jgi:hypothetical protein
VGFQLILLGLDSLWYRVSSGVVVIGNPDVLHVSLGVSLPKGSWLANLYWSVGYTMACSMALKPYITPQHKWFNSF